MKPGEVTVLRPGCTNWCGIPEVNVWVGKPPRVFKDADSSLACYCTQTCADAKVPYNVIPQVANGS